jgi:hypothetical protein
MAAVARATRAVREAADTSKLVLETFEQDAVRLASSLEVHGQLEGELGASQRLIQQLRDQSRHDELMRNIGIVIFSIVVCYVLFERVFLTLGGGLLLRALFWLGTPSATPVPEPMGSTPQTVEVDAFGNIG